MLFACIFVPEFPAEAVVRAEPELREGAVVVVDGTPPLLHVIAASERAQAAGVEVGMTKLQAAARLTAKQAAGRGLCGAIRRRSPAEEIAAHAALVDCARAFSPRIEERSRDTVLMDLDGLERLFGSPQKIAREIARRASDFGLEASVAIAANLDAAICAARGFAGITVLPDGKEAERLAPLSIEVLLQAIAADGDSAKFSQSAARTVTAERAREILDTLERWGVRTLRNLAVLPEVAVAERLGPEGVYIRQLARGEGASTLSPTESPLIFEEALELEFPVVDLEALAFVLNRLVEQLCARLSARAFSTNELRLRMELEPCGDYEAEISQAGDASVYEHTLHLPVPMLDAKIFLRLLQLELRSHPPAAPVAKIWLRAEPVQPRYAQGGLFIPAAPEPEKLELTLARIAGVVRRRNSEVAQMPNEFFVGSPEIVDTHRPGTFRMKRFAPPSASRAPKTTTEDRGANSMSTTALRVFRPPFPVNITMQDGKPAHVRPQQRGPSARAIEGAITWSAGPWRTSGDWWNEAWSRDYWDIAVETASGSVLCRLYLDNSERWFVEGTYD